MIRIDIMKNTKGGIKGKRQRYADKNKQKSQGRTQNGKPYSKQSDRNRQNPKSAALRAEKTAQKKAKKMRAPSANTNLSQNSQYIQWFPGHMTRTKRQIQSDLKLVDAVAEIIDARLPLSSRNPDLPSLLGDKPRIVLMNKCDLADPKATKQWIEYFRKQGLKAIELDCKSGRGMNNFVTVIREVLSDKIEKWEARGMKNHSLRVMIVGIPNVGKSSFINRISKTTKAKVEDRPGVTRGNQWFTIDKNIELLDTPGVLWPRFDDQLVGERLAFTGAVKDQIMDTEQLSLRLLEYLQKNPNPDFINRFELDGDKITDMPPHELLEVIAKKRGMLVSGGEADCERAAVMVLDEFRAAKLGRITLELPKKE